MPPYEVVKKKSFSSIQRWDSEIMMTRCGKSCLEVLEAFSFGSSSRSSSAVSFMFTCSMVS